MTEQHPIIPPPPHLLKKFSAQAQDEAKKRNGAGYLKTFATLCIEWAMTSKTTPNDRQIRSSEITPPPELVKQWLNEFYGPQSMPGMAPGEMVLHVAAVAARWGADQELEACCEWLVVGQWFAPDGECLKDLRGARRPKPPSLKEQALLQLDTLNADLGMHGLGCDLSQIRHALESLPS